MLLLFSYSLEALYCSQHWLIIENMIHLKKKKKERSICSACHRVLETTSFSEICLGFRLCSPELPNHCWGEGCSHGIMELNPRLTWRCSQFHTCSFICVHCLFIPERSPTASQESLSAWLLLFYRHILESAPFSFNFSSYVRQRGTVLPDVSDDTHCRVFHVVLATVGQGKDTLSGGLIYLRISSLRLRCLSFHSGRLL